MFVSGCVSWHLFAVEILAIFATHGISLGYITCFSLGTQMLWLWPGCGWTNVPPPKPNAGLRMRFSMKSFDLSLGHLPVTSFQSWDP